MLLLANVIASVVIPNASVAIAIARVDIVITSVTECAELRLSNSFWEKSGEWLKTVTSKCVKYI